MFDVGRSDASSALSALLFSRLGVLAASPLTKRRVVLLEAEQFANLGGWVVDQQFMDQMGSPYLLAHGLGEPVRDAETTVQFPAAGKYRVWVRTRDWVAPWKAPGAPGRFKVLVNGKPLGTTFGTEGAEWHWQDGGTVKVGREAKVALHDLTGFEGRCDAILFCRDLSFTPPNEPAGPGSLPPPGARPARSARRRRELRPGGRRRRHCRDLRRLVRRPTRSQGGPDAGPAGAGRQQQLRGARLAQRRHQPAALSAHRRHRRRAGAQDSARTSARPTARRSTTTTAGWRWCAASRTSPCCWNSGSTPSSPPTGSFARSSRSTSARARRMRLSARWFADCTGDGAVGALAGADFDMTREAAHGPQQPVERAGRRPARAVPQVRMRGHQRGEHGLCLHQEPAPFPRCPWALDLRDKSLPGPAELPRARAAKDPLSKLGAWYWESGFDRDPITDVEWMRDQNFRAMYGAWDTLKNVDKLYPNYKLNWAAYIAGKRESRRLLGDVVLTVDAFRTNQFFPDACFPCTWTIDLHTPDPAFDKGPRRGGVHLQGDPRQVSDALLGALSLPLQPQRHQPLHGRPRHQRDARGARPGPGDAHLRLHGRDRRHGRLALQDSTTATRARVYEQHLDELKQLMKQGVGRQASQSPSLSSPGSLGAFTLPCVIRCRAYPR